MAVAYDHSHCSVKRRLSWNASGKRIQSAAQAVGQVDGLSRDVRTDENTFPSEPLGSPKERNDESLRLMFKSGPAVHTTTWRTLLKPTRVYHPHQHSHDLNVASHNGTATAKTQIASSRPIKARHKPRPPPRRQGDGGGVPLVPPCKCPRHIKQLARPSQVLSVPGTSPKSLLQQ